MLQSLLALIFPRNCVGCGEALSGRAEKEQWEYLCADCAGQLRSMGKEACARCGVPIYGATGGERTCSVCRENPPAWDGVKSLLRYAGPTRGWVKNYKYHDARYVEREWAKLLKAPAYAYLKEWLAGAVLIPVPLHPLKRLMRGFNQSETFARLLLKTVQPPGAEINIHLLNRVRWTRQQARLSREKRLKNMKGAFAIDEKFLTPELKKKRLVLIDDLLTTGATLPVCALVLKKAGFTKVDILTVARG